MSNLEYYTIEKSTERFIFMNGPLYSHKSDRKVPGLSWLDKTELRMCFLHWGMSSPAIWPDLISSAIWLRMHIFCGVFPACPGVSTFYTLTPCEIVTAPEYHYLTSTPCLARIKDHILSQIFSWIFKSWLQVHCFAGAKRCLWQIWC